MYESHFGLRASPFQLSPDPSFYFDSKGHSSALAYLRFGAYQGEGFIVVTGEVGAGKTTLVRALLSELNTEKVVAAQVVTTQLEASDLLRSILSAFGINSANLTKAQLIASLEAFLTLLATRGQRALLIIDEAQNLSQEAVEEMRMLSNFQFGQHALLQSFLVGQPELRRLLHSKSMEQFRQRVIASCHLGPLDPKETQSYIEHRLRKVGWQDRPHFTPEAFAAIFAATGGVPRRINVLCNRLLLSAYLKDADLVDEAAVSGVADELRAEVGENTKVESLPRVISPAPMSTSVAKPVSANDEVIRSLRTPGVNPKRPLIIVADDVVDYLKVRMLAAECEGTAVGGDVVVTMVRASCETQENGDLLKAVPAPSLELGLNAGCRDGAEMLSQALIRFSALLAELAPAGVALIGDSAGILACALAASERGVPILRLDAGVRSSSRGLYGTLIDRLADRLLTRSVNSHSMLAREGTPSERLECVGSLWQVVVARSPAGVSAGDVFRRFGVAPSVVDPVGPFGLFTARGASGRVLGKQVEALCAHLEGALPLVWIVDDLTSEVIRSAALNARLDRLGVVVMPAVTVIDRLALLRGASFLVTDSAAHCAEEASVLQVPVLELSADGSNADDVAAAVRDVTTQSRRSSPPSASDQSRATESVLQWLGSIEKSDISAGGRQSHGPGTA